MTKRKRAKTRRSLRNQGQQPNKTNKKDVHPKILKILKGAIASMIAVSGILFALHPRYSIDVDERFNPYNPFQNPLVITNNGYFPLRFSYSINASNFKDIFQNSYENISAGGFNIDCLDSDRKAPIDLLKVFNVKLNNFVTSSLDLTINIESQTYLLCKFRYPYIKKETIRFKLKRSYDGKYIWQQNG